jgi:hypothetical protein
MTVVQCSTLFAISKRRAVQDINHSVSDLRKQAARRPSRGLPGYALFFRPVPRRRGEDRAAARRLRRAVQSVGGGAPDRIVGCCPMRLQCRRVTVDLEEVVDVLVLLILENVEARAAWFVALRALGVYLDCLEEALALLAGPFAPRTKNAPPYKRPSFAVGSRPSIGSILSNFAGR